jgi:hypothetical protein
MRITQALIAAARHAAKQYEVTLAAAEIARLKQARAHDSKKAMASQAGAGLISTLGKSKKSKRPHTRVELASVARSADRNQVYVDVPV